MFSFSCSDGSWADRLLFPLFWNLSQCSVFHRQATIKTNIYECNTINSILSIRTYINTSIILLPTILLSLLSSTIIRTCQSLHIMINRCAYLALPWLGDTSFAGLIMCSAISFPAARLICVQIVILRQAWFYIIQECHKAIYISVQVWMCAYTSVYSLFMPTVISGHTRLTSGHMRLISGHTSLISSHRRQRSMMQYFPSCFTLWSKKSDMQRCNKETKWFPY
jgi:hypothetical protein